METKIKILFGEYYMDVTNLPYSFDEFISIWRILYGCY